MNIARMRAPLEDPVMEGFRSQLETINAAAERSPGFVWRLLTEDGDATAIRAFEDPLILVNMSVWASLEALHDYVYAGAHLGPLRDRRQWFETLDGPSLVLWWIAAGETPTVDQGKARLEELRTQGPSPAAFTFRKPFPPPDAQAIVVPETDAEFCRG
jgi:hypothetical protein